MPYDQTEIGKAQVQAKSALCPRLYYIIGQENESF